MENSQLETTSAEQQEGKDSGVTATYTIVSYPASSVPDAYVNMIYSKWLRSLRYGNDYFKLIDTTAYYSIYNNYIKTIMSRPNSVVRLAILTSDPDVVLGWSLVEDDTLHYVYVHNANRKYGIGTALVPVKFTSMTHLTKVGMAIWGAKYPSVSFNPFK